MRKKGADRLVSRAYPGVVEIHQDRHRNTEAHPHGPACPQPHRTGSAAARLLPQRGLPDLPDLDRRPDRLPGPAHHQRGLAGHRAGRPAPSRHGLRRLPFSRLGVGDLGIVLATLILTHLIPGGVVWVAVDDTLCHKRGAKVAFGGIFLDAVLSSKKHKTLRFGLNWIVLGIAVPIPLRTDRYFCLPVLWRLYRKKGQPGYRTRPQAAATLARTLAEANPGRTFWLVGDSAYVNAALLQGRPENLEVI